MRRTEEQINNRAKEIGVSYIDKHLPPKNTLQRALTIIHVLEDEHMGGTFCLDKDDIQSVADFVNSHPKFYPGRLIRRIYENYYMTKGIPNVRFLVDLDKQTVSVVR